MFTEKDDLRRHCSCTCVYKAGML